jgi:NitT/TauT family transport system ATP-binding protein
LTRRRMQEELLQLWDDVRFTVLFVTHSIEEAIIVGNRILVLSPHPGQVKAELNAHSYGHEKSEGFAALENRIHTMLFAEQTTAPAPKVTRAARP